MVYTLQPMNAIHPPVVLTIAGHDPIGGAGIQADIEAIAAQGCHAASVITCLTVQDSRDVSALHPVEPAIVLAQARAVLNDLPVAAIKIGLIGSAAMAEAIGRLIDDYPATPVVLDPVLAAGGGTDLGNDELIASLRKQLLARCQLITPNLAEAQRLSGRARDEDCAAILLDAGARAVLLTGADALEDTDKVINRLYRRECPPLLYEWPRLPHGYHGSGCTLAAACAARLALGESLEEAVDTAQRYTWNSLQRAHCAGHGQHLPRRWPGCD